MDIIEGELTCVICSSTMTDPHQYPCGHSYCLSCINTMRSRNDYRCPECREVFPRNQDVIKNYRLAKIAEVFRNSAPSQYPPFQRIKSVDFVTWPQVLLIIIGTAILLKLLAHLVLDTAETPGPKIIPLEPDICPADLEQQEVGPVTFFGLLWFLVSLPFRIIWNLLSGLLSILVWISSSVFYIIYYVIDGLSNIIVSFIVLSFTILYNIFNVFVYVVGWICIIGAIVLLVKMSM